MYKKTVLRRLCKLIDLDFDIKQQQAFNDGGDFSFEDRVVEEAPAVTEEAKDVFAETENQTAEAPVQDAEFLDITQE